MPPNARPRWIDVSWRCDAIPRERSTSIATHSNVASNFRNVCLRAAERLLEALTTDIESRSTDASRYRTGVCAAAPVARGGMARPDSFRGLSARPRKRHRDRRAVSRPQRRNCRNVERIPGAHSLLGNGFAVRIDRTRARPARCAHAAPAVAVSAGTPRRVRGARRQHAVSSARGYACRLSSRVWKR